MSSITWDGKKLCLFDSQCDSVHSTIEWAHAPNRLHTFPTFQGYPIEGVGLIAPKAYHSTIMEMLEAEGEGISAFYERSYQFRLLAPTLWFQLLIVTRNAVYRLRLDAGKSYFQSQTCDADEPTAIGSNATMACILMRQKVPGRHAAAAAALEQPSLPTTIRVTSIDLFTSADPYAAVEFYGEYDIVCHILESSQAAQGWFRPLRRLDHS